jgi:hypothetical protein
MPAVESHPAGSSENPPGEDNSNYCDTSLAISSVVPDSQDDVQNTANPNTVALKICQMFYIFRHYSIRVINDNK